MTDDATKPIQFSDAAQTVNDDAQNRGYDTKLDEKDQDPIHITLMGIDETIINHLTNTMKPQIHDNGVLRMVPVVYGNGERWSMFREFGILREPNTDKAQTPLIMIKRSIIERGALSNPLNKYQSFTYETGWNRRNAYNRFSLINGVKQSKELYEVIIPDYVLLTYDVVLWTEYEEQMSDLIGQLQVEGDEYWGTRNDYKFRVVIDGFNNQSELEAASDRVVRTTFEMKINAYLIPERMIKNLRVTPTTRKTYTYKKAVVITEVEGTVDDFLEEMNGPAGRRPEID